VGVRVDRERGGIKDEVAILGGSERAVQDKAARGEIPGAAKLTGNRWSFDLKMLQAFVRDEEKRQCVENIRRHREDASGVTAPSTSDSDQRAARQKGASHN
jgi:hypothetical protein